MDQQSQRGTSSSGCAHQVSNQGKNTRLCTAWYRNRDAWLHLFNVPDLAPHWTAVGERDMLAKAMKTVYRRELENLRLTSRKDPEAEELNRSVAAKLVDAASNQWISVTANMTENIGR